jgi:serine/threonine protein kinase
VLKLFGVLPNSGALVLELMAGGSVDQWFGNSRLHWRKRGLPLVCQLSSALDYIHASGFMHCDIKPQNVLVDAQLHTTKLADVGVARPINTASGQIQTTPIMLSPLFIAPEVNVNERRRHHFGSSTSKPKKASSWIGAIREVHGLTSNPRCPVIDDDGVR